MSLAVFEKTNAATYASSALTLLVRRQEEHPACKKIEWLGAGVVICLERGADLHMAQLMSLPLTVSCFSKIQIACTLLVPAHPDSPGQRAVKRVCVCVCKCSNLARVTNNASCNWVNLVHVSSIQYSLSAVFALVNE